MSDESRSSPDCSVRSGFNSGRLAVVPHNKARVEPTGGRLIWYARIHATHPVRKIRATYWVAWCKSGSHPVVSYPDDNLETLFEQVRTAWKSDTAPFFFVRIAGTLSAWAAYEIRRASCAGSAHGELSDSADLL